MKTLCLILLTSIISINIFAIDTQDAEPNIHLFQLRGGVYTGGSILIDGNDYFNYPNMLGGNGGLFLRLHIGKHWAIESSVNIYRTEKTFGSLDVYQNPYNTYSEYSVFARGYTVPFHIQYHILSKKSNVRPFFSIGGGYSNLSYTNNIKTTDYFNNDVIEYERVNSDNGLLVQFSQGLTFRITKKLSITELCYYRYHHHTARNEPGMRIGICYDITD